VLPMLLRCFQDYSKEIQASSPHPFSPCFPALQIDAIYHTAVVVKGKEYFFGGGINVAAAGQTPFGQPLQKLELGRTHLPEEDMEALLADLSERYTPESYNLFTSEGQQGTGGVGRALLVGIGFRLSL
jgi:hypothetical protein